MTSRNDHIDWRRNKVLELSSQGNSEREIAAKLQIPKSTVHIDLVYLTKEAQDNLQKHIHKIVPSEYEKCMYGIKHNLKETLEIANTVIDPRVKLQARAIANDCYHYIMDLCTNAGIISDALEFVNKKSVQLDRLKKLEKEQEELTKEQENSGVGSGSGVF